MFMVNTWILKSILGQAMIFSFLLLIVAYIVCGILEKYKELLLYRKKELRNKRLKIIKQQKYQLEEKELFRKLNIRLCLGIL